MSDDDVDFLRRLDGFLRARLAERPEGSYSVTMLTDRIAVQRKIMEEAFEVCLELGAVDVDRARLAEEGADLVFHLLCGMVAAGVAWEDVEGVLVDRHGGGR